MRQLTSAFWDASSLLPLCVKQHPSAVAHQLLYGYSMVVWWGTVVEVRSGVERLLREGRISPMEYGFAFSQITYLRRGWQEVQPSNTLRTEAERLLGLYPLKAGDALQLAAALAWASGEPQRHTFISGDAQLLRAAHGSGFQTIRT